jgi:hypothetical protein
MRDTLRQAERLQAIRLRYTINTHLEDQGFATPAAIGAAAGLPPAEAVRLLSRRQWREGDIAALQSIAARLGLEVALPDLALVLGRGGGHPKHIEHDIPVLFGHPCQNRRSQ